MTMQKVVLLAVAAIAVAAMLPANAVAKKNGPVALDVEGLANNVGQRYTRGLLAIPADRNPLLDVTGEHCEEGFRGNTLYLAGSPNGEPVVRTCTIPSNTVVVIPVKNWFWLMLEGNNLDKSTKKFLKKTAQCVKTARLRLTVNGAKVPPGKIHYTGGSNNKGSGIFEAKLPRLGAVLALERGHFAAIAGLEPGQHTIAWEADGCGRLSLDAENVTYELTVSGDDE